MSYNYTLYSKAGNKVVYTNELFPLTIYTELTGSTIIKDKVLWSWGDGTKSESLTSTHVYTQPGIYEVNGYFYFTDGSISSVNTSITAYNLIPDIIKLDQFSNNILTLSSGVISPKFTINRLNSWQSYDKVLEQDGSYVFSLYATNSNSDTYDISDKYAHLKPTWKFFDSEQDTIINELDTSSEKIYAYFDDTNKLVLSTKEIENSIFVGTSGYGEFYYYDSMPNYPGLSSIYPLLKSLSSNYISNNLYRGINFETNSINPVVITIKPKTEFWKLENTFDGIYTEYNSYYIEKPLTIVPSPLSSIKISSNGYHDIHTTKWTNTDILFTISLVNFYDNIIPLYPLSSDLQLVVGQNLTINAPTSSYSFNLSSYSLTAFDSNKNFIGGYIQGTFKILDSLDYPIQIVASLSSIPTIHGNITLSSSSNYFNVVSENKYKIKKIGEDFDFVDTLKSYRFQPTLFTNDDFFDEFIGGMTGTKYTDPTDVGSTTYEKIHNFVMNSIDIDTCNIKNIDKLSEIMSINTTGLQTYYPQGIQRIFDLCSIPNEKLFGSYDRTNEDFTMGDTTYSNVGNEINFYNYVVTANIPIIAVELFNFYPTFIYPLSINSSGNILSSYPLSTYSDNWGWGLSRPNEFVTIDRYYRFFEVKNSNKNIISDQMYGIIDWDNTIDNGLELSSFVDRSNKVEEYIQNWESSDGVIESNLDYEIRKGLGLIK